MTTADAPEIPDLHLGLCFRAKLRFEPLAPATCLFVAELVRRSDPSLLPEAGEAPERANLRRISDSRNRPLQSLEPARGFEGHFRWRRPEVGKMQRW